MDAAAWTVVGVVVGAALPVIGSLWSERRADRRAEAERQERIATRLFDARRAAFEEFQSTARLLLEEAWSHMAGLAPELPEDSLDSLVSLLGKVQLYGSPETADEAESVYRLTVAYSNSDPADAPSGDEWTRVINESYDEIDEALKRFAIRARRDLGATA